ncbi:MAG TPA: multicopper oxidase domain-containing protein [Rhizomicrobium sp.]|jgi:FtsP/CotA-like multicopper oxidase with cupredoxin domain|nr:multicopper oxidase domain-containing protein [Rhizomicrobium sp.]
MMRIFSGLVLALLLAAPCTALAADGGACPRPDQGSEIAQPPDLYSENGVLAVALNYYTSMDKAGRTLFCFVTADGKESPTLHVKPGETIKIRLTNMIPPAPGAPSERVTSGADVCGSPVMTVTSVNMHFHGTNTSPRCHSDEVIRTLVNSGETFDYTLHIPKDEPPGLYWYHPHVHGLSSSSVQGGSTGAIEIEGIENLQPVVAGLPQRYVLLRDQQRIIHSKPPGITPVPNWDVSVNYVPVDWPHYPPAVIRMQAGTQEFWRVVNAGANTIFDIQVTYDGVVQPLRIVAFDGVPTGSKNGRHEGTIVTQNDVLLPPSARVEFVVDAPSSPDTVALLSTNAIEGGPDSDSNPARPLAQIVATTAPVHLARIPAPTRTGEHVRFDDLANAKVTAERKLYFSEKRPPRTGDVEGGVFYITVDGQKEVPYDPNNPPAITTTRGSVEEWTIENRTAEVHAFHMHQIHFLVEEVNGIAIPKKQQQLYDVFQIGYWTGKGPYPNIKAKLDFRGPTTGDFVYHCHILDHEDLGMMAIIRVLPNKGV